ncbi:dynamin family protein [Piscinibacter koreensis]|uniref:Dynamin family protein n=1 Tax=Piscinibacter koreensis TaxID=2742824 RepID=A0A7Y6NP36_9BURK|nr:dynamin family protein [Schlegelella koreensis]NUZ06671.1 dynamin family protein [Schlegelella koreensis]
MTTSFATSLDALGAWRSEVGRRVDELARFLADHALTENIAADQLGALRERLRNEKLVVAFVAEFSRGKSELINAIFFADTGRRILPATPGRTTMCPVELGWRADEPASLMLLPIETRLEGVALGELRNQPRAWRRLELDIDDPQRLADALLEVTLTESVSEERARALGFWDDENPEENPPRDAFGKVEVPAWRHAIINYPHPLLKQGLVVLDTPGLNAIGAEPELTLSLLPTAHATVFILGADTGVTRSDLAIWRDHLGPQAPGRFVVLNKIDALEDPLATWEQVQAQITMQQHDTARLLGVPAERVFPLSARQGLTARVNRDARALARSRLPALEAALGAQLLPQRREVLEQVVTDSVQQIENLVARQIGDSRRQLAEQMLELRGLRGKNAAKVSLMLTRIDNESDEFEACTPVVQAMRSVHGRMLRDLLNDLSSDRLRDEIATMQKEMGGTFLKFGAKKAFIALGERLRVLLAEAERRSNEIRDMLGASFNRLNAEFGFSLQLGKPLELGRFASELELIETSYVQYLGLTLSLRLVQPKFMEQFRRMLLSKLRIVFENASGEVELWNKALTSQVDSQLRERRRGFGRRREALERIQTASSELEKRITELEGQDHRLLVFHSKSRELAHALREQAAEMPVAAPEAPASAGDESVPLIRIGLPDPADEQAGEGAAPRVTEGFATASDGAGSARVVDLADVESSRLGSRAERAGAAGETVGADGDGSASRAAGRATVDGAERESSGPGGSVQPLASAPAPASAAAEPMDLPLFGDAEPVTIDLPLFDDIEPVRQRVRA